MFQVDRIINSIFDSISWLLSETESNQVWLVDCGDIDKIIEKTGKREITGVLLTHAHFDHIYGLPEMIRRYPDCVIYTNKSGQKALGDTRLNMSLYHEMPLTVEGSQVQICGEGDEIELFGNYKVKVFETPGHHPSCLSYLLKNYLFTGDSFIPSVKVVTNLPGADKNKAKESLERIVALAEKLTICPGHFV